MEKSEKATICEIVGFISYFLATRNDNPNLLKPAELENISQKTFLYKCKLIKVYHKNILNPGNKFKYHLS